MIEFQISNEKARFIITGPLFIFLITFVIYDTLILSPGLSIIEMIGYGSITAFIILIQIIENKLVPWDKPNVYRIYADEIWYCPYHSEGDEFLKYKYLTFKKIVLKNHRYNKWIELWYENNPDRPFEYLYLFS